MSFIKTAMAKKSIQQECSDSDSTDVFGADPFLNFLIPAAVGLFSAKKLPDNVDRQFEQASEIILANLDMHYGLFTAEFDGGCQVRNIILIKPSKTVH